MLMSYGVNHFYGYGMGGFGFLFDPTMILVWVGLILSLLAQAKSKSTFAKYERLRSVSGMTGGQAADRILHSAGIYDVSIARGAGQPDRPL